MMDMFVTKRVLCCCCRARMYLCLQAYNDNELAPNTSISAADAQRLGLNFWEKRTMTNDFATVVHRMKSLGASLSESVGLTDAIST